jgi:hypothetical protein
MNILNFFEINSELLLFFSYFFVHTLVFYGLYKKYQYLQNEHENFFDDVETDKTAMSIENIETIKPFQKERVPYEEKYLIEVRNMKNEYVFTDEELETEQKMLRQLEEEENKVVSQSVMVLNEKIDELRMQLLELDENDESDENGESETIGKSQKDGTLLKKIKTSLENEIKTHETKISELQESVSKNNEIIKEKARQYIINEQLKKFKNNFIIEYTPLGNVLLFYNYEKLAFEYYSDLTIPYRYLETVSRKYILTYNYRPLYVDMEEELKEYERKLEEKEKTKSEPVVNNAKKQVFAKFKSYNTEAGTGRVNKVPPPKNSIPQNMLNLSKNIVKVDVNGKDNNGKMLLKENANRYSYQGKFCNFNFLKKIDRKNVDKKYTLTFADFKKMNKLENKN